MKGQSCLVKAIIIYFVGGFVLSIIFALGYLAYASWTEVYLPNPMAFTFCWSVAASIFAVAIAVPILLLIFKKDWAKFVFFAISLPAIVLSLAVTASAFVIDLYLALDTEFGIEISFPIAVLCVGLCAVASSLIFALSMRLLRKRRISLAIMRRVFLPFVCLTIGATGWAFLVDWLIVGLTGLEQIIHFISITGAIFGVSLGAAAYFMIKPIFLGFFSGVGVAIVFLDYLVYGCIMLFQVPAQFYWIIAVGFMGLYFLLGLIYCLTRLWKIRIFVGDAKRRYWLTD